MNRLYVIPVKYECNADCTFCITEEAKLHPAFSAVKEWLTPESTEAFCQQFAKLKIKEVEVTGGGEPFLNPKLQQILNHFKEAWPDLKVKIYTNGFLLKPLYGLDEVNISRAHDDTVKNNEIFRTKHPIDLTRSIAFFRPLTRTLRVQVPLLKGYIDTPEAAIALIERHPLVDQFVFRPLFSKVAREKDKYVQFSVIHPRAKNDVTGDYCGDRPVLASNGKLFWDWNYTREIKPAELTKLNQALANFKPSLIR